MTKKSSCCKATKQPSKPPNSPSKIAPAIARCINGNPNSVRTRLPLLDAQPRLGWNKFRQTLESSFVWLIDQEFLIAGQELLTETHYKEYPGLVVEWFQFGSF